MSEPVKLKENYGKIPENLEHPEQEIKLPPYWILDFNQIRRDLELEKPVAGTHLLEYEGRNKENVRSFCVLPIKDEENDVTGWLISDFKDQHGNRLWTPRTNLIILQGKMFFTEYGQSLSKDKVVDKHLKDSDAQRFTESMLSLEISSLDSKSFSEHSELFSFFSRRLAELGEDRDLKKLQKLLAYCAIPAMEKSAVKKVQEILPDLIASYRKLAERLGGYDLHLLLLNAIDQRTRAILNENLENYPTRKVAQNQEIGTLIRSLDLTGFTGRRIAIGPSIKAIGEIRKKLKSKGKTLSREGRLLLKAIDLYENCLTAIYAKDANQPLQTDDLTCFEIFAHKMRLAAKNYLEKRDRIEISIDNKYGLPQEPQNYQKKDSFQQIAFTFPKIYSQHFLAASDLDKDELMYRWALQHAEKMGVPVGNYEELDEKVYDQLSEVAKLDDPRERLVELDQKKLLKETAKEKIRSSYVPRHSSEKTITLTIQKGQNEGCCLPENKVLVEMAREAGWQTGRTKRLLNAIEKKDVLKCSVEYLIDKLKLKSKDGYNKKDVHASIWNLKKRKISIDDLQGLDRPSTAKVILAAKKCRITVDANCKYHLADILGQPHHPSFF